MWHGGAYGKYKTIQYTIEIPPTQILIPAKTKKQALKEAKIAINLMLEKEDWWKERIATVQ